MGGSFIAYELAEGIVHRGLAEVTWIMRGRWFLRYLLDAEGGQLCRQLGEAAGVRFLCEDEVERFSGVNGHFNARTACGHSVDFDTLTYGVGLDYYVEPTRGTGIETRRGLGTDSRLPSAGPPGQGAGAGGAFFRRPVGRLNRGRTAGKPAGARATA